MCHLLHNYPIGSMYAIYNIYGDMDPINIPQMLAYRPAPWILWIWKITMLIMGKFTIVMVIFHSYVTNDQRVTTFSNKLDG